MTMSVDQLMQFQALQLAWRDLPLSASAAEIILRARGFEVMLRRKHADCIRHKSYGVPRNKKGLQS